MSLQEAVVPAVQKEAGSPLEEEDPAAIAGCVPLSRGFAARNATTDVLCLMLQVEQQETCGHPG
jgi:hypothetical protein